MKLPIWRDKGWTLQKIILLHINARPFHSQTFRANFTVVPILYRKREIRFVCEPDFFWIRFISCSSGYHILPNKLHSKARAAVQHHLFSGCATISARNLAGTFAIKGMAVPTSLCYLSFFATCLVSLLYTH